MPLTRIRIENYKSIKFCDISTSNLNLLIGGNGTGKTNILDAIRYFYDNIITNAINENIYDANNRFSNCVKISLYYDLSEFVKIAKTNTDKKPSDVESVGKVKYEGYYKAIMALKATPPDNIIVLSLTQIKGKGVSWNYSYEERFIIKSLFPFFYVDTRSLDITEWSYMWDILSDLSKVSNIERASIERTIHELVESNSELSQKIESIKEIFYSSNINMKNATPKEFAKNLTSIYFSGDKIFQKGKQLDYYSTGTNSVKYIELLLKSINKLAKTKMKEPIILFDEPEISLHPNYIDELSYTITDINHKLNIIISTHSSRLIKNILTQHEMVNLYSVKLIEQYTDVQRMRKFLQYSPVSKYRVTDDHVNAYFSKSILFVEGETELELFANPYLKLLYPKLKKVDVFKATSDAPLLNIMNPNKTKTNIPYLCIIDIDKAIRFEVDKKRLSLKNEYFGDNINEKFLFRNKKEDHPYIYHQRIRINSMTDRLHIHYLKPFYACSDDNYYEFIEVVQKYLSYYNIFAFKTTIEGALINQNSYEFAMKFLEEKKSKPDFSNFKSWIEMQPKINRINALRIVFNGKSDLLQNYNKKMKDDLTEPVSLIFDKVMIGKKTSGWVTNFLDDFFNDNIKEIKDITPKKFKKYIESPDNKMKILKVFANSFPEIHLLIEKIVI